MTRKVTTVLAIMALFVSFTGSAAFAQGSSAQNPGDKSALQACDSFPDLGTRIDFEAYAPGTSITNQYEPQGVRFGLAAGGPNTIATTDGARPLDGNILAGQPIFTGEIHASFWSGGNMAFATQVGATVGYLDQVGTVVMFAYDCEGDLVAVDTSTIAGGNGIEFMSVQADTIHKVVFDVDGDVAGSDIDCFTFDNLTLCESAIGQIPTLTEWGLIIFSILLFGWMAWVIVRRRRASHARV